MANVNLRRSRAMIKLVNGGNPFAISREYPWRRRLDAARVVDLLSEDEDNGGAAVLEGVLPETAKAVVFAFDPETGWSAALDEIAKLRKMVKALRNRTFIRMTPARKR